MLLLKGDHDVGFPPEVTHGKHHPVDGFLPQGINLLFPQLRL